MNIIVAITGASGAIYGKRALEILKEEQVETSLIISKSAVITINKEIGVESSQIESLASKVYKVQNIGADIASGSFRTEGMLIAPCSIKTMSEIANGISSNLISRSADVCLKEQRKLVLMLRETPLNYIHLTNMQKLSQAGAIIAPPVPAFYNRPQTIDDLVDHSVCRVLDLFGVHSKRLKRWDGK